MKGKRGSSYTILIIFMFFLILNVQTAYATPEDVVNCNLNGGIWCGSDSQNMATACKGQNSESFSDPALECVVQASQNVTLDRMGAYKFSETKLKVYTFDSFEINSGVKLQFYLAPNDLTLYKKAVDATCAIDIIFAGGSRPIGARPTPANTYTSSIGGKGGSAGMEEREISANIYGGGGGAGAGGGKLGVAGGDGFILGSDKYSGGAGKESRGAGSGACAAHETSDVGIYSFGGDGGRAGGFVSITANTLTIEGEISVSGEDGGFGLMGSSHTGSGDGGYGGGPGAGGGGAGKLVLNYNIISGAGSVTANGGDGGKGGAGGKGRLCGHGAPGGGGGGGDGGIVGLIAQPGSTSTFENIMCDKGLGGIQGDKLYTSDCSGNRDVKVSNATNGADGKKGACKLTEMDPLGDGDLDKNRCNDGLDNDNDAFIDMDDSDCYNAQYWDASIWAEYAVPQKPSYYDRSATDSNDLACGDDFGLCTSKSGFSGSCGLSKNRVEQTLMQYGVGYGAYDYGICPSLTICDDGKDYCGCNMQSPNYNSNYCISQYPSSILEVGRPCVVSTAYCSGRTQQQCTGICEWAEPVDGCENSWGKAECEEHSASCLWVPEEAGTSDLGGVSFENKYMCADSWDDEGDVLSYPGNDYVWLNAEGTVRKTEATEQNLGINTVEFSDYTIFQVDNTQFISNKEKWFQCNAMNGVSYTVSPYLMGEFGTFTEASSNNGKINCIDTLENAVIEISGGEDSYIWPCTGQENACISKCTNDADCEGYCVGGEGDLIYERGNFVDDCGNACHVKNEEEVLVSVLAYYDNDYFKEGFCSINTNALETDCQKYIGVATGGTSLSDGYMDQGHCKVYPELCVGGLVASEKTCEEVHESMKYVYSGSESKLCDATEYCNKGTLLQTSDSDVSERIYCCLGKEAYCEEFRQENCASLGGDVKPNACIDCVCKGIEKEDCCINGEWNDYSTINLNPSEAFICYKEEGDSLIKECCGSLECYNGANLGLNKGASLSGYVNALGGVPFHGVMSFDDIYAESSLTRVRSYHNKKTGDTIKNIDSTFLSNMKYNYETDWSGFTYLEFDILYNDEDYTNYYVNIIGKRNSLEANCTINILDTLSVSKGPLRWQHAKIELDTINDGCVSALDDIDDLNIILSPKVEGVEKDGISVLLDNFFLSTEGNADNSENRFCSGNWGDWVENLDGPIADDEVGFYLNEEVTVAEFGSYRDACEGVISFGWTGSVCCGDDTRRGALGEFWVDSKGVCWNGTSVLEGKTVADALGINPLTSNKWETSLIEKSLLFHRGKLLACDLSANDYNYEVSFDGINPYLNGELLSSKMTFVSGYSIMGEWFCEPGNGWTKVEDVNKIRILASAMKGMAENLSDNYTLMCGKFASEVNLFGTMTEQQKALTAHTCVLRIGDNEFDNEEKVILGLEMQAGVSYDAYKTGVLSAFPVLGLDSDTCAGLPDDIENASADFFLRCAEDEDNDFYLYYSKPLGLIILSDGLATQTMGEKLPFFKELWEKFKAFFARLFRGEQDVDGIKVHDFDTNIYSKDFYLSVQDNRIIRGVYESTVEGNLVNAEYSNFNSSVEILSEAVKFNYPLATTVYVPQNEIQTIYVSYDDSVAVDWRLLTSILRVIPEGAPGIFVGGEYSSESEYTPSTIYNTVHDETLPPSPEDLGANSGEEEQNVQVPASSGAPGFESNEEVIVPADPGMPGFESNEEVIVPASPGMPGVEEVYVPDESYIPEEIAPPDSVEPEVIIEPDETEPPALIETIPAEEGDGDAPPPPPPPV